MFLKNFECARVLSEEDLAAWIRRFDKNVDGGLTFGDLVGALQTMTNYVRKDGVLSPSKQKLQASLTENTSLVNSAHPASSTRNLANAATLGSRKGLGSKDSLQSISKLN